MSNYTMEIIDVGAHCPVEAYAAQGYFLHRYPELPIETNWQVRRGLTNVLIRGVSWCEAKDEFWRNTGIDLGNAWGDCHESKPAAVVAPVVVLEPSPVNGTHFASFDDAPVTAKKFEYVTEENPMCQTRAQAIERNCPCAAHQEVDDQLTRAIIKGTATLAVLAVVGSLIVLASAFVATLAAVTGTLYLAYTLRHQALAVGVAAFYLAISPLRLLHFFGGMVVDGLTELRDQNYYQAQMPAKAAAYTVSTVKRVQITADNVRVVEPLLLSDNNQATPIEFTQRMPVHMEVK